MPDIFAQEDFTAGVDIGSTQAKAIILNTAGKIVGRGLGDVKGNVSQAAREVYDQALEQAKIHEDDVSYLIGTGYGRFRIAFGDAQITEISCHTRGARHLFPKTRTVIDIGGQDTKVIRTGPDGNILDFTMNDKCSAGTGRFLGAAAMVLEIPLPELGPLALACQNPVKITTTCTVFAESEIISYVAKGKKTEDILMGMHESIAQRTISLAQRVGIEEEITFTGGVARNLCVVKLLEQFLGTKLNVNDESQFMGALGAALLAMERIGGRVAGRGAL